MKILLTGAAGYLGSVLTGRLIAEGYEVRALDNFMFQQSSLNLYCPAPTFEVMRGDARDKDTLKEALDGVDMVIPLAALVCVPICKADTFGAYSTNFNAIDTLCQLTDKPIIMPVTNSGYGIGQPGVPCTEESPLNPLSVYGKSKVMAESAVRERGNAICLRLATVFGMSPRMRIDLLVNDFVYRAMHDRAITLFEPHFMRNYIHIQDVSLAFLHAIRRWPTMKDNIYNVGLSSANCSKFDLCGIIKKHFPEFQFSIAEIGEDPDKRDYMVSNAKLEATGWEPQFTLDDGILELKKGYTMLRDRKYGNA